MRAQILSYDFFVASLVVLAILLFIFSYFFYTSSEIRDTVRRNDMARKNFLFSQIFSKTGSPLYWSPKDVVEMGLINGYQINETKLIYLMEIGDEKVKSLSGIAPYNFYFEILLEENKFAKVGGIAREPIAYFATQDPADIAIRDILNVSGLIWDFYWGGPGAPPPTTARYIYIGEKTSLYKQMIANSSNYFTIISEDPHVDLRRLTEEEEEKLRNFVAVGNTFLHIQHPEAIIEIFGPAPEGPTSSEGTAVAVDEIFSGKIGENYTFQQSTKTFSATNSPLPLKVIMEVRRNPDWCIFCKWSYGEGRIYYLPDASTIDGKVLKGLNIVGENATFGVYPVDAKNILVFERFGAFKNDLVKIRGFIWE